MEHGLRCTWLAVILGVACSRSPPHGTHAPSTGPEDAPPREREQSCSSEELRSLVEALRTTQPGYWASLIVRELPEACEVPASVRSALELIDSRPDERGASSTGPTEHLLEVCPDAERVMHAAAEARVVERGLVVFDGCDLGRFGVIEREPYQLTNGSLAPWLIHQWLIEEGVARADAVALTTALLVHDMWALDRLVLPKNLTLPIVASGLERLADGPIVHVARDGIEVSSYRLARIEGGAIEPGQVTRHLVDPLYDWAAQRADMIKQLTSSASSELYDGDWSSNAMVVADEHTPSSIVLDVCYTLMRAELRESDLVVATPAGGYAMIPVSPPTLPNPPALTAEPAALLVTIDHGGFEVSTAGGASPERLGVRAAVGHEAWDYEALGHRAAQHLEQHPEATTAIVTPAPDIPHGVVVRALAALRGPQCRDGRSCVLPRLELRMAW